MKYVRTVQQKLEYILTPPEAFTFPLKLRGSFKLLASLRVVTVDMAGKVDGIGGGTTGGRGRETGGRDEMVGRDAGGVARLGKPGR